MAAAWSSGGNMPAALDDVSGCGVWNAALATRYTAAYTYSGTAWATITGPSGSYIRRGLVGTTSAAWLFAGMSSSYTENFNGSAWASGGGYGLASDGPGDAGTQTAGLGFGGDLGGTYNYETREYNGTTTAAGGNLPAGRMSLTGAGTQTAALSIGGMISGGTGHALCYLYDGGTWSSGGSLSAGRSTLLSGAGTQSAGIVSGGLSTSYTYLASAEAYNGSTWSSAGTLTTARNGNGGGGASSSSYLTFGGTNGSALASTEEYNDKIPGAFSFVDQVDVNLSTLVYSGTVTPTGYDAITSWTCSGTGASASINGGAYATSGTISPGQTVQLKTTSSALYATAVSATLTINGVADTWYVTTRNAPVPQIIFL